MRILVGMPEQGSRGGPAACEPPFIEELRRLGNEVEEEVYAYAEADAGLARRVQRVLRTARRFKERMRARKFDLVHINTSFDTKALLRDAIIVPRLQSRGAKVFLKLHGSNAQLLETKSPMLALARRRVLSYADAIGVLSTEEQENFLRAGIPANKICVVKNVIETNAQQSDPEFRQRWNLPQDRPLLLFIGRFIPAKGLRDVIHAGALLRDRGQQFYLLCVGDGPARSDAEREVERLKLKDCVRFTGFVPEEQTASFYANSTVLVFPTYHYEGFPMVVFNAVAAGLPIVTTRIRGAADQLKEPENCLWVEPRKSDQLANKIIEILANSELRSRMGANNKRLAMHFSAEIVAREYLNIYETLVRECRSK